MGHRALVAYERPDRLYELRYSHWGGEDLSLVDAIATETPLADGAVDDSVLAESIARGRILADHLDPCIHEALFLVAPAEDYAVDPYLVCWLEWGDGRDAGRGALVAVDPDEEADRRRVRTWFRATKTALADVIEMGALSRRAAQAYLEARVCEDENGTIYTHGGPAAENSSYDPRPDRWLEDERWGDEDEGGAGSV